METIYWMKAINIKEEDAPSHEAGSWLLLKTCLRHGQENKINLPTHFSTSRGGSWFDRWYYKSLKRRKISIKLQKSLRCQLNLWYWWKSETCLHVDCPPSTDSWISCSCSSARKSGPCVAPYMGSWEVVKWASSSPQLFCCFCKAQSTQNISTLETFP